MPYVQGVVAAPSTSNADGANPTILQGKTGEVIVAELHGIWYTAAYRGRAFHGAAPIAGVILPRETTTAATFMLFNPAASGVNVELISFDLAALVTTAVIGSIMLAGGATPAPSSVTSITASVIPALLGGASAPKAALYSAATITAMTTWWPLFALTTTTGGTNASPLPYTFNGRIAVAPAAGIMGASNPVQTGSMVPAFDWAEWPL
jgi:hypothetical protein